MNNIELFYEVKNLFNTSEEAFNIYRTIRYRQRTENRYILYVCTRKEEAERLFKRMINKSGSDTYYKMDKLEVTINNKMIRFTDITEFKRNVEGKRYGEVRFLG